VPVWILSLLGSKWTWIAAGVVIAITAAGLYLLHVYNSGVASGAAAVTVVVQQKTIQTQQKMDKAQDAGPHTQSDVVKSLRAHAF
jgi:hypothetical protein